MIERATYGADIHWVFFDCFNTILKEPEGDGPYPYLTSIASLTVRNGLYRSEAEFLKDYAAWYKCRWPAGGNEGENGRWREMPLAERLNDLFQARLADRRRDRLVDGRVGQESQDPANERRTERAFSVLITEMITHLADHYLHALAPTDRVGEMLDYLAGKARLAVVSNFYIAGWPAMSLNHFGLGGNFDFVLDCAAFGIKKPGAAIYEEALRRAGARPEEVLFVGDSWENDILMPLRLGMSVLHVQLASARDPTSPEAERHQIQKIAHWDEFVALWDSRPPTL